MFDGTHIRLPTCYIAGAADWGIYQSRGAFERMQTEVCTQMLGVLLLEVTGHWVQRERAREVNSLQLEFLRGVRDLNEARDRKTGSSSLLWDLPSTDGASHGWGVTV